MQRAVYFSWFIMCCAAGFLMAAPVQAARFQFCWIGGGGYTMRGMIEFPDTLLNTGIITQDQVTDFAIWGFHDDVPVGSWALSGLKPTTTWEMSFDTTALAFPMGGVRAENTYQAWNANGEVNDCGADGFGFNGGNWAQDVCINNTYIEISSIDRYTPLPVYPDPSDVMCRAVVPLS